MLERLSVYLATDLHDAAQGLQGEIACCVLRIRSCLSEIRHRRHDNFWVPGEELVDSESPLFETTRSKTFDDDIALFDQLLNERFVLGTPQIQRETAFVPVEILK